MTDPDLSSPTIDLDAELARAKQAADPHEWSRSFELLNRVVPVVKDTYQWYAVADLFVLPSDLESLPRSVLEAMAFGVPVAAARAFGLPELIDDGRTGYLCEPRDLVALSEMLEQGLTMALID